MKPIQIKDLGLIDYESAYQLQKQCVDDVLAGGVQRLLLCEHPPTLTMGRLANEKHILYSQEDLSQRGVKTHFIDRGGEVTLHAPGQLVIYPILRLENYGKDLHRYLNQLEQLAIDLLKDFGIVASRFPGKTGAWVDDKKIASIGIGVRKWVSYHGIAININTDIDLFSLINPCGLDVRMISLAAIKNEEINMGDVKRLVVKNFGNIFN